MSDDHQPSASDQPLPPFKIQLADRVHRLPPYLFGRINALYAVYLKVLSERPRALVSTEETAEMLLGWGAKERSAWGAIVSVDPFLPGFLLPAGYLGRHAWTRRVEVLGAVARQAAECDGLLSHVGQ